MPIEATGDKPKKGAIRLDKGLGGRAHVDEKKEKADKEKESAGKRFRTTATGAKVYLKGSK